MTTIAWDGNTLAADKQCTDGNGLIAEVCKIWRTDNGFFVGTGSFPAIHEFMHWFRSGAKPADFPALLRDKDRNWVTMLWIAPDRTLHVFENSPFSFQVRDKIYALGSGRDFALGAMACGRTAVEAVGIACQFDSGSGKGIDWEQFPE